jgi:hypothetical protein
MATWVGYDEFKENLEVAHNTFAKATELKERIEKVIAEHNLPSVKLHITFPSKITRRTADFSINAEYQKNYARDNYFHFGRRLDISYHVTKVRTYIKIDSCGSNMSGYSSSEYEPDKSYYYGFGKAVERISGKSLVGLEIKDLDAFDELLIAMFSPPLDENGYDMSVANVGKFMKKRLLLKEATLKRKSKKIL